MNWKLIGCLYRHRSSAPGSTSMPLKLDMDGVQEHRIDSESDHIGWGNTKTENLVPTRDNKKQGVLKFF
jgi:hypothetical protein